MRWRRPTERGTGSEAAIDAEALARELGVDEAARTAEAYFARVERWEPLLAKPLASIDEAPYLLVCFGALLSGLRLAPGMDVLDFGAGSGWTTGWLAQLGCRVTSVDASATALRMGERRFAEQPPFGPVPAPRFATFDGRRLPLEDASADRAVCFDALHHVVNPEAVLAEMARVLRPGGVAAFNEPGPRHSRLPQAQAEMRHHRVVERDIVLEDLWAAARRAGFADIEVAVHAVLPMRVPLPAFSTFLAGGGRDAYVEHTVAELQNHRLFWLRRDGEEAADSRARRGLRAELAVRLDSALVAAGGAVAAEVTARNAGTATWLADDAPVGAVRLGAHLFAADGALADYDWLRRPLGGPGRAVAPGETVTLRVEAPAPPPGRWLVEWDLVSEGVSWFAMDGSPPVRLELEVAG